MQVGREKGAGEKITEMKKKLKSPLKMQNEFLGLVYKSNTCSHFLSQFFLVNKTNNHNILGVVIFVSSSRW